MFLLFPRFATCLGDGITPQLDLAVQFGQLLDAQVKNKLVFYIAQEVCDFSHVFPFFHQRTGYAEAFLCQPYNEMLFL